MGKWLLPPGLDLQYIKDNVLESNMLHEFLRGPISNHCIVKCGWNWVCETIAIPPREPGSLLAPQSKLAGPRLRRGLRDRTS